MNDTSPLPDCLALRIGLAARQLPDTTPGQLLRVLVAIVGEPLTEAKLNSLKVKDLKTGADGALEEMDGAVLRQALDRLHGEEEAAAKTAIPAPQVYEDGPLPDSIQIACASNNSERLDGHFGSCARFLIYQVSATAARLVAVRPAPSIARLSVDHSAERVALISDCDLLCVLSIGGPAAARVVNSGVHPFKRPQAEEISALLHELQQVLAGDPPPWLAKRRAHAAEESKPSIAEAAS
ncbi:dinitrogenase iron-molybdenum cofactor biosynthesis protein [Candidatus Contendibacter odensensis]|uniref:Dinitrogenase iron-molybdenum cofactor biosynthesis protein n=1 Tax=Candidatus Contendobacter odensis Run_B_J11 TaxID=1400861 RepID=A0A7U7GD05_9GAMM|nr:dinitrogenase iron-molybdenum cofactor biosynthesis protein [Candidatus Contendobacter odensis]CDH46149.1 putative dinitrogenase iron-molybdenum cofactor biosynthesis protein [Candidatus Contendobacter odensis Run_B_J11]